MNVGDIRKAIAALPDDAPVYNDVMSGPAEWTVNLTGCEGGVPKHWQGVGNAHEIPQALWIHTEIVPMEDDEEEE